MIHNKYFEILELFTGDNNKEIYGRELIGKINLSQKGIALALEELEDKKILTSKKKGNIKLYSLNKRNPNIKDIIIIVEQFKKIVFLQKERVFTEIFKDDDRIVGIFGSYAKEKQKKDSDIDVFIIGNKKKEDYDNKGKIFDIDISVKYFKESEILSRLRKKDSLIREILSHHILLFNAEKFVTIAWREYYGLN